MIRGLWTLQPHYKDHSYFDFIVIVIILIVGTKIDLRENKEAIGQLASQGLSPVKREQGIKLANKIRAVKYMECSALTQRGLKQVRNTVRLAYVNFTTSLRRLTLQLEFTVRNVNLTTRPNQVNFLM